MYSFWSGGFVDPTDGTRFTVPKRAGQEPFATMDFDDAEEYEGRWLPEGHHELVDRDWHIHNSEGGDLDGWWYVIPPTRTPTPTRHAPRPRPRPRPRPQVRVLVRRRRVVFCEDRDMHGAEKDVDERGSVRGGRGAVLWRRVIRSRWPG